MPRIVHEGGKYTFEVDGKPFIMLGAQVHNSSGWTALYDTIETALKQSRLTRHQCRALLVISDGIDNHSGRRKPASCTRLSKAMCKSTVSRSKIRGRG
jgi:hypothetical protein